MQCCCAVVLTTHRTVESELNITPTLDALPDLPPPPPISSHDDNLFDYSDIYGVGQSDFFTTMIADNSTAPTTPPTHLNNTTLPLPTNMDMTDTSTQYSFLADLFDPSLPGDPQGTSK